MQRAKLWVQHRRILKPPCPGSPIVNTAAIRRVVGFHQSNVAWSHGCIGNSPKRLFPREHHEQSVFRWLECLNSTADCAHLGELRSSSVPLHADRGIFVDRDVRREDRKASDVCQDVSCHGGKHGVHVEAVRLGSGLHFCWQLDLEHCRQCASGRVASAHAALVNLEQKRIDVLFHWAIHGRLWQQGKHGGNLHDDAQHLERSH